MIFGDFLWKNKSQVWRYDMTIKKYAQLVMVEWTKKLIKCSMIRKSKLKSWIILCAVIQKSCIKSLLLSLQHLLTMKLLLSEDWQSWPTVFVAGVQSTRSRSEWMSQ